MLNSMHGERERDRMSGLLFLFFEMLVRHNVSLRYFYPTSHHPHSIHTTALPHHTTSPS